MTMERSDYPAILPQVQPNQAVDILNDRVRQVGRLNTAIADWLQERRRLEEQYSLGLRKLARRQLEDNDLGIFSVPWTTLTGAAGTMADSHSALASKIEVDVEQPLREFATTNREMQAMTTIQGNLASMAKDVDRARQRAETLERKGEKAATNKIANATSDLDTAQQQWDNQAPYVFENLQAVDETRLNMLRDVLTQYQTHEVDMVQKSQTTAEHCLNVLLSLQTADEIKTFALKAVQGRSRQPERTRGPSIPNAAVATPSSAAASSSALTPTMSQPDDESTRSGSVQEEKKKSRFGGLKRLGTVVGGKSKRESRIPDRLPTMTESPEPKPKSPFNSLGGRFSRKQSDRDIPTLEPPGGTSSRDRPRSPLRMGSEMLEPPSVQQDQINASAIRPAADTTPQVNGTRAPMLVGATAIPDGSHQGDLADLEPPKPSQPQSQAVLEMRRDSEGYSVPPSNLDPISQAQADASAAGEGAAPAFNVNIRNAPIQEEGGDSETALASMANKLQAPPMIPSKVGTVRGRRTRPVSTISNANSFAPAEPSPAMPVPPVVEPLPVVPAEQSREVVSPPSQVPSVAPLAQSPSGTFGGIAAGGVAGAAPGGFSPFASTTSQFRPQSAVGDHTTDTGSIRSGRSLTSTTSQGVSRHPDLVEAGLNTSVVETVSARFEQGQPLSSSLIGEIALAYNQIDFSSPTGIEHIRLENFASLEKVAPNPAFIAQAAGKDGEYSVNLASLAKTQVAFKYQVRTDDAGDHAPLLVTPAFKIEANQASIIVSYALNPSFKMHSRENVTLSNVVLVLTLEGAKATGCQSRPVGTFSRERNSIFWQLGDVTLVLGGAPEKLLARFATESEAKTGSVEARWEISSTNVAGLGSGLAVSMQSPSSAPVGGDGADPFADEEHSGLTAVWKEAKGVKKLVSGAYSAR